MKSLIQFLLLLCTMQSYAQIPVWEICVEKDRYYSSDKDEDFILKKKPIKFCYNKYFFGFNTKGYIQIFPLEMWNQGTDRLGNITEEFINGECLNYERGDLIVTITHSKPQTILINYTRNGGWGILIETNSLYVGQVENYKPKPLMNPIEPKKQLRQPKSLVNIDSLLSYMVPWSSREIMASYNGYVGNVELTFKVDAFGNIEKLNKECIRLQNLPRDGVDYDLDKRIIAVLEKYLKFERPNGQDSISEIYNAVHMMKIPLKN